MDMRIGGSPSAWATQNQSVSHHHHGIQSGQNTQNAQEPADPAFMEVIAQSLATTLQSTHSAQTVGNTSNTTTPATSTSSTTQALAAFMQNLMTALVGQNTASPATGSDRDGDGDRSLSATEGATSPHFNSYLQAMGG